MATQELKRFRILCDWRHDDGCAGSIVLVDVAGKYEAEDRARNQGWTIGLSASCKHCQGMWRQVQKAKGVSDG